MFISTINADADIEKDWRNFIKKQEKADLEDLITEEKLKEQETRKFVANTFRDGVFKTTGTNIDRILPSISHFGDSGRKKKRQIVIDKLEAFFEKYFGLGIYDFTDGDN